MKYCLLLLFATATAHADVIIDGTTNNGGFVSPGTNFNGAPDGWSANSGVWIDSGNSSLSSAPFGADTVANSRFIQIHKDTGEILTSTATFTVVNGDMVNLSFDYKTAGSGNNTTLTVSLWDSLANTTYATLGSISATTTQSAFTKVSYSTTAASANANLRLRFTLTSGGKDVHIDRVHLSGGVLTPPTPPVPIDYANVQELLTSDTDARIVEKAAKLLPRANQVTWQRMETTFFIHYGPNAFNGVEWGTGFESPSVFNPTALDAEQWVSEIENAGGKMVMLVVKHHDGFCLWPSRYTNHDVAASPWLAGNGDLARLVSDACAARGIAFGVYLSPADLYQIESNPGFGSGLYGNGSRVQASVIPTAPASFSTSPGTGRTPPASFPALNHTVDDYNRYFLNQLYELLTEYGPIAEIWFDGATPKQTNPPQQYDRQAWYSLIRSLQPDAVIAIKGPGCRWVGNESGIARETEWSPLPIPTHPDNHSWDDMTATDLGSRAKLSRASFLTWYPAEVDVPVLHGWFWAPNKTARTATELVNIYFTSVGRNANLLLNFSPDTRGLIPDKQLAPVRAMAQVVQQTFGTNLAAGATPSADSSHAEHPAARATDGNPDTWWEPTAGAPTPTFALTLPAPVTFDVVSLQEAIGQRGQRIESFAIDTWNGSAWTPQSTATTIGYKRLIKLAAPVTSGQIRIRILQARLEPTLAEISLHRQADLVAEPGIARTVAGQATLSAVGGETIRYTLDGSEPTADSPLYSAPFGFALGGTIRAIAIRANGSKSLSITRTFGLAPAGWSATADTAQTSNPASYAIDGNPATFWHTATDGSGLSGPQPHTLTLDMTTPRWIGGFTYLPRQDTVSNGIVKDYRIESSLDGSLWTTIATGSFANIQNNPVEQTVPFTSAIKARWLRFVSLAEVQSRTFSSAAEITVLPGGFDAWKTKTGMQMSEPNANPDGDGLSNLLEYALAGNPVTADPAALALEWLGANPSHHALRFKRPKNAIDLSYELHASPNLNLDWQAVDYVINEAVDLGGGIESVSISEIDPPVADKRFFRLLCILSP